MGYVHHSNYALYLEQARMELFAAQGLDLISLEETGVILPLASMQLRFISPLHFGDRINVETRLSADNKFKLEFQYRIFNQDYKLIARASTALVFAEKESGKLIPGIQKYMKFPAEQEELINS